MQYAKLSFSCSHQTDRLPHVVFKGKQLQLQSGPDDVLRGRHGPIPAIRAREAFLADAQKPGATRSRSRFCWGHPPTWSGRRCGRTSCVALSRSRLDSRLRSRVRGRRLWLRATRMSIGRVRGYGFMFVRGTYSIWGCDGVAEHSTVGAHVRCERGRLSSEFLSLTFSLCWYSCTLCAVRHLQIGASRREVTSLWS
jgi:hypothetical protein